MFDDLVEEEEQSNDEFDENGISTPRDHINWFKKLINNI